MNIQIRKIGFRIRITERQMCPILFFLSSQNLCKKNVAIERALCVGFDILFLSADLTVIKDYDILFFILFVGLKYDLTGVIISLVDLFIQVFALVLILIGNHRCIRSHLIPEFIGDLIGKVYNLDFFLVYIEHHGLHVFRITGKMHTVRYDHTHRGTGLKAFLPILFIAGSGKSKTVCRLSHADCRLQITGSCLQTDGCLHILQCHSLFCGKKHLFLPAEILPVHRASVFFRNLRFIGRKKCIQCHVFFQRLRIGKALRTLRITAPAAKGIPFFSCGDF